MTRGKDREGPFITTRVSPFRYSLSSQCFQTHHVEVPGPHCGVGYHHRELSYNVSQRLDDLQQEFPPDIQQTLELVGELAGAIWRKSNHAAEELYRRQDLGEPLASVMSHYFDPVREMVEICLEPFRPTLDYMLNEKLPKELNILDAPFSFYFKRLQDTQTSLQPFANQVHTYFRQMVEALHKNLKPYLRPILDESEKYKMEAREWSLTSIFPPNT
nr:uncharacterized protein LOC110089439 isoform X3 [Pogona vitticeps]